jgi:hypothetical protein
LNVNWHEFLILLVQRKTRPNPIVTGDCDSLKYNFAPLIAQYPCAFSAIFACEAAWIDRTLVGILQVKRLIAPL